jgi:hypothetical protein
MGHGQPHPRRTLAHHSPDDHEIDPQKRQESPTPVSALWLQCAHNGDTNVVSEIATQVPITLVERHVGRS